MQRGPVWTGHELSVHLFKLINGLPLNMLDPYRYNPHTDIPLLSYCYWQTASVTPSSDLKRRPSTDRSLLEIIPDQYIFTCRITSMYCIQEEFCGIDLFNRRNRFLIVFSQFSDNARTRASDQHILYNSAAQTGEITFQENGITEISSLIFGAEDYFQSTY